MATRNVVLTDTQSDLIDRLVASGRYQNASGAVRLAVDATGRDLAGRNCALDAGHLWCASSRRLIAPDLPEDLRFTRSEQHFVVPIAEATQVIIADVLHSRTDLPGKLAALRDPKSGRGT